MFLALSAIVLTLFGGVATAQETSSCYTASVNTIGTEAPCKDMLIVDRDVLLDARIQGRGDRAGTTDRYISHGGVRNGLLVTGATKYTFGDSTKNSDGHKNVFTGQVTSMSQLFDGVDSFNADIGYWDTGHVINMSYMFQNAEKFNQDIGKWITSKVTSMAWMFLNAHEFNQDIGDWNTSQVTSMAWMFQSAHAFNQNIGKWNTSKVINMDLMFSHARAFNQDLRAWNVASFASKPEEFDFNTP